MSVIACAKTLYQRHKAVTILWLGSALLVFAAAMMSSSFVAKGNCGGTYFGYAGWFSSWDGQWYGRIADKGYSDGVHFFPLYPLLGAIVHTVSGLNIEYSLLAVSLMAGYFFTLVWKNYLQRKSENDASVAMFGTALVLLWPASYFMRANYTESLYLLLTALFLLGMLEKKPVLWLVMVCGLLTATRPNGLICPAVLGLHCLLRDDVHPYRHRLSLAISAGLASCWGIGAYMVYLAVTQGDPMVWLKEHSAWLGRDLLQDPVAYWGQIVSLRPAWGFLFTNDIHNMSTYPFNLQNKVFFLLACAALPVGVIKKWVTREEFYFCLFTLMMVYHSNAQIWMTSIGRFCLALLPVFYVYVRLLARASKELQLIVIVFSAACLCLHTGLFVQYHCLY